MVHHYVFIICTVVYAEIALIIQDFSAFGPLLDDHLADNLNRLSLLFLKKQQWLCSYGVAFLNRQMMFFNSSLNRFTSEFNCCQV